MPQNFQGLLSDPMFMAGMGLLSGSQPGGDPFQGLLGGMQGAQQFGLQAKSREDEEKLRRELMQYFSGDRQGGMTGHVSPPRTQGEAATMRALAMGQAPPDVSGEQFQMPYQPGSTQPAGLLAGDTSSATSQVLPPPPQNEQGVVTDAMIEADPDVSPVGGLRSDPAGILATTPGDTIGTPRQEMAQATEQAQQGVEGLLGTGPGTVAGGGQSPEDVRAMFGLLAQYGDPQKAAEGYINYQLGQQRLQQQASQTRTQGLAPITAEDGTVYFRDFNAPGGVVVARDNQGNPIKAPLGMQYVTDSAGNTRAVPRTVTRGETPTPQTIVTAETVAQSQADVDAINKQATARRSLGGIEDMIAQPGGAWETVNAMLSPEMQSARELVSGGSSIFGVPWSYVPGTDAADFRALQGKLGSQAFIDSITQLRQQGGTVGQITEREGAKLENARLRLVNASSDEQFQRELVNFRDSLRAFLEAARREAGVDTLAPYVPGGVDFRTDTQRATDEASAVEVESGRLQQLQERYPGIGGN